MEFFEQRRSSGAAQVSGHAAPSITLARWLLQAQRWRTRMQLKQRRREAQKMMYVVERLSLGPKRELVLVCCLGERYLVGAGADGGQMMIRVGAEKAGAWSPLPFSGLEEARRWG